jgi:sodium/bile acid cotransporter 7
VLLFFLHGAKLSREAIVQARGIGGCIWGHAGTTFALFPLLGLAREGIPGLPVLIASGMLFLTLLPSTVQVRLPLPPSRGAMWRRRSVGVVLEHSGMVITPLLATC